MDEAEQPGAHADGVAVISVWTRAAGGGMLARLTLTAADGAREVRVVSSQDELRSALDEWFSTLVP